MGRGGNKLAEAREQYGTAAETKATKELVSTEVRDFTIDDGQTTKGQREHDLAVALLNVGLTKFLLSRLIEVKGQSSC